MSNEDDIADAVRLLSKPGRVLIVPRLADIDRKRGRIVEVVQSVLESGNTIIEAETGWEITPECLGAVLAGLAAPRHDVDHRKVRTAGKRGGEQGYTVAELEACKSLWESTKPGPQIANESGIAYTTLWRYFSKARAIPVTRGRRAGRTA